MKRLLLTVALCLTVSASFAQKKNVNTALSIAKAEKPDFGEARTLIKDALVNPESKDDAKTWYVAGFIENQQFDSERMKQVLGQQPNEPVMYDALGSILPYFLKAAEIDQAPNEKGKIKPKFIKDIKSVLGANHIYYINAGAYYFDKKDYKKAYDYFADYLKISDLDMFKGEPVAARDSNYLQIKFYSAVAASQMGETQLAVKGYEDLKQYDYKPNDVYTYLCMEYEQSKDTANWIKTLEEGVVKFPNEEYYMLSLINLYIFANENEKAVKYLNTAIEKKPSAQLYDVLGRVYDSGLKDRAKAEECFMKALEIDPEYSDAIGNLGRIFYNEGVNKLGEANLINDTKLYKEESEKAKALFTKALPYFQKAHKLNPKDSEYMTALRGIYYNLNMGTELEAIEKEIENK